MSFEKVQIMQVPPYLKAKDLSTYFGIGERETWRLLAHKQIKGSKIGNLWKVDSASVIKYLCKHQNTKEASNGI